MFHNLNKKLKESFFSVFPVVLIVLAIALFLVDIPGTLIVKFCISSILLFLGIGLFSLGADTSMMPIGQNIASSLTKSKKLWILFVACLVMGLLITIAEPDLSVLANQVPAINKWLFVATVGIGVGICFVLGAVRILFRVPLAYILTIGYVLCFVLLFFVPETFWAVAFDASGVTTGAISVPFIMSFCLGMSAIRGGNSSEEDSFGLVAICSMGPVLAILILGLFFQNVTITQSASEIVAGNWSSIPMNYVSSFGHSLLEVALVLLPIAAIFFLFQFTLMKLPKIQVAKISIGLVITYLGISIFMTGVNVGFSDLGSLLGEKLASSNFNWLIYPIAFVLGYVIVAAEPAVHILTKQVADVSGNTINRKVLKTSLSIGVACSVLIAVIRATYSINILYFVLPIFAISLALSYYNPKLFTAVGFDAGGIASGPMSATFLLPFVAGIASAFGADPMIGAFGTVSLIATTPILVIQILGAVAKFTRDRRTVKVAPTTDKITIIHFDY